MREGEGEGAGEVLAAGIPFDFERELPEAEMSAGQLLLLHGIGHSVIFSY